MTVGPKPPLTVHLEHKCGKGREGGDGWREGAARVSNYNRSMARVLPIVLGVALIVFALIDCIRTPRHAVPPGPPKEVWVLLIIAVPVIGAIAWLIVSRSKGIASGGARRTGPVAPDDDPEFLADLDWQARKAYHERMKAEREAQGDDAEG